MDAFGIALSCAAALLCSVGTARLIGWILDRRDAALIRKIEAEAMIAIAAMEHAEYLDPYIVSAEQRAERLSDATMCEAEWSR
ncbi:hypothetical protein KV692_22070 [Xanthomonas euvesicatoria pv. physalidis]|uniref:hypothetical protein n=1 Tax=Xanthomonas euvesicatoria TaxID=456327 RepID=UPI001C480178|nr:hypothetical protein [Xanthomonas euvesicatoria]MBV6690456.1 hypothetical protein [Xanthomonas euvesicatoria pv. physalidis]